MKHIVKTWSFNAATRQITLTNFVTVRPERVALITDITTGKILYSFAGTPTVTLTAAGNVLTLSALQGGEANADVLRIDYNTSAGDPPTQALTFTHSAASVSAAGASVALAANLDRQYALLVNDSAVVLYLNIGGTATANTGIRLNPNGGSYEMGQGAGNLSTDAVSVIAASGTGNNLLVTAG